MRYSDDDGGGPRDWEPGEDGPKEASGVTITGAHQIVPSVPDDNAPPEAALDDWSFVRGTSPDPDLPHWTEAPTGQVPAVLARDEDAEAGDDPWSSVPSPTWREDETDWTAHEEGFEPAMLGDEAAAAVPSENERRPWEFESADDDPTVVGPADEEPAPLGAMAATAAAAPATRVRARNARSRRTSQEGPLAGRTARPSSGRNMPLAVLTGIALGVLVLVFFNLWPWLAAVIAVIFVTMGAGEAFGALRLAGHRPAAALGLVACMALMVASYNKGVAALPLVTALCFVFTVLWYLGGVEHADSVDGVGTTMLVYVWVGVLGAFAGLLLQPSVYPGKDGMHLLMGAIILSVANDVGALFCGKAFGSHPLAPHVSPNKTWEGVIGGGVLTLVFAPVIASFVHPWTAWPALTLAIVVAVVAPLGDLCESMFKRSMGVKDIGRMLPGHGGVLDRLDGLLFVLPATYYVVHAFSLT